MSFSNLMRNKKFKGFVSTLYSLGAAVVVLGALFKIQHWTGSGFMLAAGLITEAVIFVIYAFEPNDDAKLDHHTIQNVSLEEIAAPSSFSGTTAQNADGGALSISRLDKMLEDAAMTPEVFFKLGEGMKKLGEATENMNSMIDVTTYSVKYVQTLKKADDSLEKTAKTYESMISNVTSKTVFKYKSIADSLSNIESGAKEFEQQMSTLNNNLSALNTVYKLQRKEADDYLKDQAESAAESKKYREQVKELNKNLVALNQLYSNMLSAVKTK